MQEHVQCKMRKGDTFQTAWIPSKFAVHGKILKLHDDNGWEVIEVNRSTDSKNIPIIRDIYRQHRKVTDI